MSAVIQSHTTKPRKPRACKPKLSPEELLAAFLAMPDDGLVDSRTLAAFFGCTVQKVEQMRKGGDGPRYFKICREVRYLKRDVLNWVQAQSRTSTSQ